MVGFKKIKVLQERINKLLPRTGFAHSVSVLASGTVAAQLLIVLAAPLLTRLYDPEEFGLYAIYAALLLILGVSASLRYQLAIPIANNKQEAHALSVLSLLALIGSVALVAVLVTFGRERIASLLNAPELSTWLVFLPVSLLIYGLYQILASRSLRAKRFTTLSSSRVAQAIAMTAGQLLAAPLGVVGLLVGQLAGQSCAFLMLLRKDRTSENDPGENEIADSSLSNGNLSLQSQATLRRTAVQYHRFPLFSTWGGLFNVIGQQSPAMLLAVWYSPAAAGFYALAQRLLSMPMTVIGSAVSDVFLSGASEAIRDGSISDRILRVHRLMARLALPPTLLLTIASPDLFSFVFGANWREAGVYAAWLAPMLYLVFVTSPLSTMMTAMNRENEVTFFQSVLLGVRLLALWMGTLHGDAVLAIAYFSFASSLVWLVFLLRVFKLSGNRMTSALRDTLGALIIAILICLPLLLAVATGQSLVIRGIALLAVAVLMLLHCIRLFSTMRNR